MSEEELKNVALKLEEIIDSSTSRIDRMRLKREAFGYLGKMLLSQRNEPPTTFDSLPILAYQIQTYANYLNLYGEPSESFTTIYGATLVCKRPEEIAQKTGYDQKFVEMVIGDLLKKNFLRIEKEGDEIVYKPVTVKKLRK